MIVNTKSTFHTTIPKVVLNSYRALSKSTTDLKKDTHHPAVRTHPVTGLKALNVNLGFVTGFAELKKEESDQLLQFFKLHIHSADDHYVRWKWAVGSVAMWDNVRCSNIFRINKANIAKENSNTSCDSGKLSTKL